MAPGGLRSRVRVLLLVALGLLASMALGILVSGSLVLSIVATAGVGALATFLAHALRLGPPGAAVAAAERAVEKLLAAAPEDADAEALIIEATNALHDAWTTLWDSGEPVLEEAELATDLIVIQQRYSAGLRPGQEANPDLGGEPTIAPLGRPRLRRMIARGDRWPTAALQAAIRVTVGIGAAGVVSGLLLGTGHMYWAMAAAALVLHTGMDRRATAIRSVVRLAGTALGIGLFLLGGFSGAGSWALVITIVTLQGLMELFVVRNYTIAVIFMTPLALTIGTAGSGLAALTVAQDRLVDTAVGVLCAAAVPWLVGWRSRARLWSGSARRSGPPGSSRQPWPGGRRPRRATSGPCASWWATVPRWTESGTRPRTPDLLPERSLRNLGRMPKSACYVGQPFPHEGGRNADQDVVDQPRAGRRPAGCCLLQQ